MKKHLARRRPIAAVRREAVAMANSLGYSIGEILADIAALSSDRKPVRARKRAKVAPKYRDPENARNTWSGRGRIPRWLAEKVQRGGQAADYLIPGLARPTAKNDKLIGRRTVFKRDRSD